jgi:hypothetical protein
VKLPSAVNLSCCRVVWDKFQQPTENAPSPERPFCKSSWFIGMFSVGSRVVPMKQPTAKIAVPKDLGRSLDTMVGRAFGSTFQAPSKSEPNPIQIPKVTMVLLVELRYSRSAFQPLFLLVLP